MEGQFGGSVWRNESAWQALRMPEGCPICHESRPSDVVGELTASWVTAPPIAPLPGYVAVVSKRHVVEPFELPGAERAAFWEDAMHVAAMLAELFRPVKVNYEIHGNSIPHLHMHIYPRFPDDPFVGQPIDPRSASIFRDPEDIDRIRRALAQTPR